MFFTYLLLIAIPVNAETFVPSRLRDRPQVLTTAEALVAQQAPVAQQVSLEEDEEEITITGTRTERTTQESPSSITVIEVEDIDRGLVNTLEDLIRYEPGVSAARDPRRYGFQDFNIRGLEGNRVLIQVDGIRQPESFSFGSTRVGRDGIDPDALKRVEIIRGSASTLYGSDAIGGVVTFLTKDPSDFLTEIGDDAFLGVKLGYDSANQGLSQTVTAAGRLAQAEVLAIYTNRNFQETTIRSDTSPNPEVSKSQNWLLKVAYKPDQFNTFKLTGEFLRRDFETEVLSSVGIANRVSTASFLADDQNRRDRFSLSYEFRNPSSNLFFQTLRSQIYYQSAETIETAQELRRTLNPLSGTPNQRRDRQSLYGQYTLGGDLLLESNFKTGALSHRLVYGLDVSSTQNVRIRDGSQTNLLNGAITKQVGPDLFPVKDFADTRNFKLGLYIQDEITAGNLTIIPGIRFDAYELQPEEDSLFRQAAGSFQTGRFRDSALSPRLGLVYKLNPETVIFAQYAKGFRAPTSVDINPAFTNPGIYRAIPNPNLEAESSDGFEVGLRGNYQQFKFGVSGFYNTYRNFINTFGRVIPTPGLAVGSFQTVNIEKVRIWGLEGRAEAKLGGGFSLLGSIGYTVGDDLRASGDARPLASIDPVKAVVGLRYREEGDRWGTELSATFAGRPRLPKTSDLPNPFVADAYTTVDWTAFYKFNPNASLNVGVYNLFNTQYFLRSSTRGLAASDPLLGLFAQPGITFAANFSFSF
ncbi:TonB-dependent hemoglobin/transferrin/lactoferrin family receptor [Alkalinema pantanalense CENA528]|uniref:TonB-dependent hemoglobin/transferrin/lactoferrin family receptor n=1 Tax=Alkalinema pantanalense TaxID=1620705 RepID=UPI003D6DEA19